MAISNFENRFFFILSGIVLVVALLIIRPFFSVLVISIAMAVIFDPVYRWLRTHVCGEVNWVAALLTVVIGLVIIATPMAFVGKTLFNESQNLYQIVNGDGNTNYVKSVSDSINNFLPNNFKIPDNEIKTLVSKLSDGIGAMFTKTISTIFSFLLVIIAFFYFLKDGKQLGDSLVNLSPLSDSHDRALLKKVRNVINGVVKGYFLVGIVQGASLGLGFWIFGVPSPVLWGTVTAFASLVPTIGTAFVSVPGIIYLFATGATNPAIGLIIWSVLIVGLVDNLLNPFVVGKKINVPPLFILFSVLGGISLFGAVGVLVGPIVVGLLYELVTLYREKFSA
jgi:predicted PurR-regulated permease PerM